MLNRDRLAVVWADALGADTPNVLALRGVRLYVKVLPVQLRLSSGSESESESDVSDATKYKQKYR